MRIAVSGHSGFIGTALVALLESEGHHVIGCSRATGCDVTDFDSFLRACRSADLLVHLAADARPAESLLAPADTIETNVRGAINAGLVVRELQIPLIYCSSCEIYGDSLSPLTETSPLNPTNPYSASKLAADRLLYAFHRAYGIELRIGRLFNPYGPNQQLNKVIPTFFHLARQNLPITVYGDGEDFRDYLYVADAVRGLWKLKDAPSGTTVNLATGRRTTTNQLASVIVDRIGSRSEIQHVPYPTPYGGIRFQQGNPDLARAVLNWHAETQLEEGLDLTFHWLEQNRES